MLKLILSATLIFSFNSVFASPNNAHLTQSFRYAKEVDPSDFLKLDPRVIEMIGGVAKFCKEYKITFMITSVVRTPIRNKQLNSVSTSHVDGRAIDFSIKKFWGWNPDKVKKLEQYINRRYGEYGLYSPLKRQKVIVIHDNGNGNHAHIQVTVREHDTYTRMLEDILP